MVWIFVSVSLCWECTNLVSHIEVEFEVEKATLVFMEANLALESMKLF